MIASSSTISTSSGKAELPSGKAGSMISRGRRSRVKFEQRRTEPAPIFPGRDRFPLAKSPHIVPSVCALVHIRIGGDQLLSNLSSRGRDTSGNGSATREGRRRRAAVQQFAAAG